MTEDQKTSSQEDELMEDQVEVSTSEEERVPEEDVQEMTTLHERTIAALSYVGFFAIVPFYLKKDSKFCRFHGKQGMLIALIFFFAKLLLILDFLMDIALLLQFIIFVFMSYGALSGKWKKFPWIYKTACQLEDVLSLHNKKEEPLKPGQVNESENNNS